MSAPPESEVVSYQCVVCCDNSLCMTVSPCDSITMQQCYHAIVSPCNSVTMRQCYHATVLPCDSITMQQCCHATVLPCNSVAMQQCCRAGFWSSKWTVLCRMLLVDIGLCLLAGRWEGSGNIFSEHGPRLSRGRRRSSSWRSASLSQCFFVFIFHTLSYSGWPDKIDHT